MLAYSTTPQKHEQPGLTIQAARNLLTNTTLNYERSQQCLYPKRKLKAIKTHRNYLCRWTDARTSTTRQSPHTKSWGTVMSNNKNNIVELHPTNTSRDFESKSRFETPFLATSNPDGTAMTIKIDGDQADSIKFLAMRVDKTPQDFASGIIAAHLDMETGGGVND